MVSDPRSVHDESTTLEGAPQADPELSLSGGRATPGQIALTALALLVIIGVFIYGLTHQRQEMAESSTGAQTSTAAAQPSVPPPNRQQGQNTQAARGEAQAPGHASASPSAAAKAPPPTSNPNKPAGPEQAQSGASGTAKSSQASRNQQGPAQPSAGTVSGRGDSSTDNMGAAPARSRNGAPPANSPSTK